MAALVFATLAAVLGTWKGESLCTVKPSACHDEVVVYYITAGDKPNTAVTTANKIVDGKERFMGALDCAWDDGQQTLRCMFDQNVFAFVVSGKTMRGRLDLADGTLFRKILAKKTADTVPSPLPR